LYVAREHPHPFSAFRIDLWDEFGNSIFEHLAGIEDSEVAKATYQAAVKRWPKAVITLRQRARIIYDSRRPRVVT